MHQGDVYEAVFISKLTCQLSSFFVQNFVQTTSTLCKTTTTLCKTTSTLYKERRQLCTNNVHTLYEQRHLCTNNDNFVRTTSTLYEQRQLCTNNVHTCPNSAEKLSIDLSSLRKLSAIPIWRTIPVIKLHASGKTVLINKISTFYLPGILRIMRTG